MQKGSVKKIIHLDIVAKIETRLSDLDQQLVDPANLSDRAKLIELNRERRRIESEMGHVRKLQWPSVDPALPEYASLGGHGTADYSTLLAFLGALDSGRKPALDETRAWDMTVPGLIAAESAARGGAWMHVPAPE